MVTGGVTLVSRPVALDKRHRSAWPPSRRYGRGEEVGRSWLIGTAWANGRVGGRPTVMTPENLAAARALIADGTPLVKVAKTVGVSRAPLYRHLGEDVA
jgi:hypothetical protein